MANVASKTVTTYMIGAYLDREGQRLSADTPEVLGVAYSRIYTDRDECASDRDDLQDLVASEQDPATVYVVEEQTREVTLDLEAELHGSEDGEAALSYYVATTVQLDGGAPRSISAMVGVPDDLHGTAEAAGGDTVGPYCSAWLTDSTDLDSVAEWARDAVLELLVGNSLALYRAADLQTQPLTYEVFDGNPNEVGGCGWPDISGSPDAEEYDDAQELATAVLDWAAGECDGNRDYSIGDTLYVIVRRPDGSQVQDSRTLELEDFDGSVSDVNEWEHIADYVACLYGTDGDQPGDCVVEIGKTPHGAWYVRHGDDGCKDEDEGPFATRDEAEARAQEWADELNEACEGEDAEAMQARLLAERAGEPDEDGEYCVYWETAGDDDHVVERYGSAEAAEAAAELRNQQLAAKHPGGNLLCGYAVRQLVDDEWIAVEA